MRQAAEEKTGSGLLAIAHNGNLSNGQMFPMVEAFGKKIDQKYAQNRIKWERLYEVTQNTTMNLPERAYTSPIWYTP